MKMCFEKLNAAKIFARVDDMRIDCAKSIDGQDQRSARRERRASADKRPFKRHIRNNHRVNSARVLHGAAKIDLVPPGPAPIRRRQLLTTSFIVIGSLQRY